MSRLGVLRGEESRGLGSTKHEQDEVTSAAVWSPEQTPYAQEVGSPGAEEGQDSVRDAVLRQEVGGGAT